MAAADETAWSHDSTPPSEPIPAPWPEVCECTDPEHVKVVARITHAQPLADREAQR